MGVVHVRRLALAVTGLLALGGSYIASQEPAGAARLMPISRAAWAGSSVNVVANARQPVFTHGRTQFAAFYDADRFMVLARRSIEGGAWETRRTAYQGNAADAHNSISLVADGAGLLHVAWDHHGSPLNYARGAAPGSIELGPKQPMTGQLESRVTYPQFHRLPGGDLLFLYRDGASGRGVLVLTRYAFATGRWTAVQANLIDGEGERSPYWDMTIDRRARCTWPGSGASRPMWRPITTSATRDPTTRAARGRAAAARASRCPSRRARRSTPRGSRSRAT